jgi:hypothetical protein
MHPAGRIGIERQRQIQVRKAFTEVLERGAGKGEDLTEFYEHCGDYMVFTMDRLHWQDQVIHDLLKERVPADVTDIHDALDKLQVRQGKSRDITEKFQKAIEALKKVGRDGCKAYEAKAKDFIGMFGTLLQSRKNPFYKYTDELFSVEDWEHVVDATPQAVAREDELYTLIQKTAPAGIDPASYPAEPAPSR